MLLSEIAERVGLKRSGEDVPVSGPSLLDDARPGTLCLATSAAFAAKAAGHGCAALLTTLDLDSPLPCLRAPKPRVAFARVLAVFDDRPVAAPGIHPSAVVSDGAKVDPTAAVCARAVVEDGATIGPGASIGAGAYVGHESHIGADCVIGPNVVIYHRCTVGDRTRIHGGSVIGADGFGYEWDGHEHVRVPHIGHVVIEEDVDIGANSCVDRAKTGETRVGRGTKVDNLVQIAHGVKTGPCCVLAAQAGVAGSVTLGKGVVLAGQSGVLQGTTIGDGAVVAAQSAVVGSIDAGRVIMGTPAREATETRRIIAAETRLPAVFARLRALERRGTNDEQTRNDE
jgi:UDP-3-O-[3-hydroxymyristoyl] glucosamine N-acyltransferase